MPNVCRHMGIQDPNDGGCLSPARSLRSWPIQRLCSSSAMGLWQVQGHSSQLPSSSPILVNTKVAFSVGVGRFKFLISLTLKVVFEVLAQCGTNCCAPPVMPSSTKVAVVCVSVIPQSGCTLVQMRCQRWREGSGWGDLRRYTCIPIQPMLCTPQSSHYTHLSNYTVRFPPLRMKCDQSPRSGLEAYNRSVSKKEIESPLLDPLHSDGTLGSLGCLIGGVTLTFIP